MLSSSDKNLADKGIEFRKYKERGACHWRETKRSMREFNADQEARFELILQCLGDIKNKRVLDVGCGDGALTYKIALSGAQTIGIDNSVEGVKLAQEIFAKKGILADFIVADAGNMPIENDSVDMVVLSEVIEHVSNPNQILKEIKRVLKCGGKIIVSTPYRLGEIPWDHFHVKEYYPGELKSLLAGFFSDIKIIETHPAFWKFLYCYGVPWFKKRPLFRWLVNLSIIYFNFCNPFLRDSSDRKRREYFTQLTFIGRKT